jgi:glycosyltransferase 2 family protein
VHRSTPARTLPDKRQILSNHPVAVLVVVAIARFRRLVWTWARRLGTEGVAAVRGLRSPRRVGLLFGGDLASEVLFAASLGLFARAFGFPVGPDELLLINISVGLLSGLIPVPGGVALVYRMASFYLPPIWGYFALRWLERRNHL